MCIIDGNIDCIINPIQTAIKNVILSILDQNTSFMSLQLNPITYFITNIVALFANILFFITDLFYDIFGTNPYAAATFGLILFGISTIIGIRVYNIIAGIEILGFKLPRL